MAETVDDGWTKSITKLRDVFQLIPPARSLAKALDGENDDVVHLVITSKGSYQVAGVEHGEEHDGLPEMESTLFSFPIQGFL